MSSDSALISLLMLTSAENYNGEMFKPLVVAVFKLKIAFSNPIATLLKLKKTFSETSFLFNFYRNAFVVTYLPV